MQLNHSAPSIFRSRCLHGLFLIAVIFGLWGCKSEVNSPEVNAKPKTKPHWEVVRETQSAGNSPDITVRGIEASITIGFSLPGPARVSASLCDAGGVEAARLLDNELVDGGFLTASLDGSSLASGPYTFTAAADFVDSEGNPTGITSTTSYDLIFVK